MWIWLLHQRTLGTQDIQVTALSWYPTLLNSNTSLVLFQIKCLQKFPLKSWNIGEVCGKPSAHYQATSVNAVTTTRDTHTHTHSPSESHSFNKRDMKTFHRHPRLSPEIISHHINHSVWNRGEKADKLKRRQEQLSDTCPEHSRVICTFGNKSGEALIRTLVPILTWTKILLIFYRCEEISISNF